MVGGRVGLEPPGGTSALCEHDRADRLLRGLDAGTLTQGMPSKPPS